MSLVLLVGGIRSGKSEMAERIALETGAPVVYVATGSASDGEMVERIARHRARRPKDWRTIECPDPTEALADDGGSTVIVDGISGWLLELMKAEGLWTDGSLAPMGNDGLVARDRALDRVCAFTVAAARRAGITIVVAEESGLGVVPTGAGTRRYVDLCGEAIQILAEQSDRVRFVVAGQPVDLKESRDPISPELRLHGDTMVPLDALDFAVNVAPQGPPKWLREHLTTALDRIGSYPDEGSVLRSIADRHSRSPDEVLLLNGSAEGFWLIAAAFRPRRAVCVHPTFTEGEAALRAFGHGVERSFRDAHDFSLHPEQVPFDADLVLLCNPNNPTGTLDPADAIERLVRPGRIVVVDEAFMEFSPGEPESLASRSDLPDLVVLRSLTKVWSIPGVRAGYLLASPDLVAALRAMRQPWGVNAVALAALETCVADEATPRKIAEEIAAAREDLCAHLAETPRLKVWPSAANFLLIEVPDGPSVRAGMLERGIAVRRADTFPGLTEGHLRITVRLPEENRVLVDALKEVVR